MCYTLAVKLAVFIALIASAAAGVPLKVAEMTTKAGKTYRDVTITEKREHDVSITHAGGTARISYEDLPGIVRYNLGGFDPEKAKEARAADEARRKMNEAAHGKTTPTEPPSIAPTDPAKTDRRVEPKSRNKLFVKPVRYGGGLRLEITGTAGASPLRITAGGWSMTVDPWTSKTGATWGSDGYVVSAWENGVLIDRETSRQKTGLGGDTRLRRP